MQTSLILILRCAMLSSRSPDSMTAALAFCLALLQKREDQDSGTGTETGTRVRKACRSSEKQTCRVKERQKDVPRKALSVCVPVCLSVCLASSRSTLLNSRGGRANDPHQDSTPPCPPSRCRRRRPSCAARTLSLHCSRCTALRLTFSALEASTSC